MRHSLTPDDQPPANSSEKDIILLLHRSDRKGLAFIFNQHHIALFYFAMQFTGDALVSQDIVEACFVKLWDKRNDFHDLPAVKSFLYSEIKEVCVHRPRLNGVFDDSQQFSVAESDNISDCILIKAELLQRIWQDIEGLPPLRRKIVKMTCFEGLNAFEIASSLNISVDTVRVQKAKAMHTIRMLMSDPG